MVITVYDSKTKEVIASIDTDTSTGIAAKGLSVIKQNTEPAFKMIGDKLYLDESKFILKL